MEKRRAGLLKGMESSFSIYYPEVCFNQGLLVSHPSFIVIFLGSEIRRHLEGHLGWDSRGRVHTAHTVLLVDGMLMAGQSMKHFYLFHKILSFLTCIEIINYYFKPMILLAFSSEIKLK